MRFAFISPRYGAEIEHGSEHVCRLLAERVADRHDVEVLTTCARDASSWNNDYPEGADRVRGVLVRRFAVGGGFDPEALRALTARLREAHSRADEQEWVRRSGSTSPGLADFLKRHHRNYDALVFFSYRAGVTVNGIGVAPERSVLFPCADVDPVLRLSICQETLARPKALGYLSAAERRVVRAYARARPRSEEIVGIGVDPMPEVRYPRLQDEAQDADEGPESAPGAEPLEDAPHLFGRGVLFRRRQRLHGKYVLHAGTVEPDNGTEELIEYFGSFAGPDAEFPLVLMGVKLMKLPQEPWLRLAGVLPERERMAALEAADVSTAPDPADLAGERVLESLAVGTPVLATARSAAAIEHCRRSNGGLFYASRDEFVEALRLLMTDDRLRASMGRNGRRYVQQHFRWEPVLGRFDRLVGRVRPQRA